EGYVVEFSDGSRFKFKGDRYQELQKAIMGLTYKNVLRAMSSGILHELRSSVPEEYLDEVNGWTAEIQAILDDVTSRVTAAFATAPKDSRKDFAAFVKNGHPDLAPYLFAML